MAVRGGIGGFLQGISGEEEQDPSANAAHLTYQSRQRAEDRGTDLYDRAETNRAAPQANNQFQGQSRQSLQNAQDRQRSYQQQQVRTIGDQRANIADQRQNIQQQQQLGGYNQAMMEGRGPSVATGQLRQGIDQSIAAQVAAARSGSNPGGEAAAMRGAQQQAAGLQGQAAAQASQIRAQESQAAAQRQQGLLGQIGSQQQAIGSQYQAIGGQQAGLAGQEADIARQNLGQYGLESQNALANAQLQLQSRNADDQRTLGMYQAALGQQNVGANLLHNQQQIDMQGYQARTQGDAAAREEGSGFLGGIIGAAGGVASLFSDANLKDFTSGADQKEFTPTPVQLGARGGGAFQSGMASGAKLGSAFAGGIRKAMGSGAPEVGSDEWARKTLSEPMPGYSSPNRPDATQGPDWIQSYMSGRQAPAQAPMAAAGGTGGTGGLSTTVDPYSDAGLKDFTSGADQKDFMGSVADLGQTGGRIPLSASSGLGGVPVRGQVGGGGIVVNSGPALPGAGGGSGHGMSYMSDEESKSPRVRARGREAADDFMDSLHAYMYKYKDPADEPRSEPTGGQYLGITAQDMEKAPKVGRQIVVDSPAGKKVNTNAAVSALLGSVARLNERLKGVEGGKPLEDPRGSKHQPPPYDSSDRKSSMTPKKKRSA